MYARQITSESVYTLREARKIIEMEQAHKREVFLYKAKQKVIGILSISVGITELALCQSGFINEAIAFTFMIPLGILLLFTKKNIIN